MSTKIAGNLLKVYTGASDVPVDCQTDANIDMSADTIDVSCKDNTSGWGGSLPGLKTGSLSGSAFVVSGGTNGYAQLFASFNNREEIDWKLSDNNVGFESGKGYITSLSRQGGVSDAIQFSFTISFSSEVTYTAI